MENAIEITGLSKSFNSKQVLKDIHLTVPEGKTVVTLGKSGTGKSVILKCIVRLLEPDKGSIKVLGKEMTGLTYNELQRIRTKIGYIFQSGALYDSMTVKENLKFPLVRLKNFSSDEINNKIETVLNDVGLPDTVDKMPSELSGGMRKRISVARTIILEPAVMLWDEPTTGLDPETAREISSLIRQMQQQYNVSSIVVTHDKDCSKIVGDSIVVLKNGEFTEPAPYEELERSNDEFIKSFFI
ncbi:MAG TPA: ATP-binding cassette domain-containing protein [Ignavibacteria bacterium]|jgi:phospholipid/cholesterol/gamma-HCH transport system ATP-binding protein